MASADTPSLLVVIFDVNPSFWCQREENCLASKGLIGYRECVEQLFLFLNAYLMLHAQNRLGLICNHPSDTRFLFPVNGKTDTQTQFLENITELREVFKTTANEGTHSTQSQFSAALSLALCYINRAKKELSFGDKTDYRILIIQGTSDAPSQYIPMMNCIFSAQKIGTIVDACILNEAPSTFLQQATDLTNGSYLHLPLDSQTAMLQYLFNIFLPDKETRAIMNISLHNQVDFRASCFCHRNTIDTGYVCSVCLSIFCVFIPYCSTCGTKFSIPRLKKSRSGKKKKIIKTF